MRMRKRRQEGTNVQEVASSAARHAGLSLSFREESDDSEGSEVRFTKRTWDVRDDGLFAELVCRPEPKEECPRGSPG